MIIVFLNEYARYLVQLLLLYFLCYISDKNAIIYTWMYIRLECFDLIYWSCILFNLNGAHDFRIMQACSDVTFEYAHTRKQFGKNIAEFQLIQVRIFLNGFILFKTWNHVVINTFLQGKMADMYTSLCASRSYLYSVARACDNGNVNRKDCAAVILHCAENATKAALEAIQILGYYSEI